MATARRRSGIESRTFGPTKQQVPVIGQGTWYIDAGNRLSVITALRRGLDLGLRHIDTAELYGEGEAERIVGEAIVGRRDEVFLVAKVLPENASRLGTLAACERSLARLRASHLDCYLLHWRGDHPVEDTIAAFKQLVIQGKIARWGVSNFDVPDLEDALSIVGPERITCNQVLYHLEERSIEHAVLPWCEHHRVAVVAYSPFGHGHFAGSHTRGGRVLKEVAETHSATTRQVALAFLVRRPFIFAIPKAPTPDHAAENAGAGNLRRSDQELSRIDQAFPFGPPRRGLPML
jgi:diketogulonate reductase-like aldo/keto reductase